MTSGPFRALSLFLTVLVILCGAASAESGELFDYRILEDGSAMITGYRGSGTDLVIPETVAGLTVSGLGGNFGYNTVSVKDIRNITIPDTMTVVEPGALQSAEYLTEIRIAEDHPALSFAGGVLYDRTRQSLLLYLRSNTAEHFDIPDGIREIGDGAFYRAKLTSVSFPGSVERIGRNSFNQCVRLQEVSLAEGLKTIDTDAFTNCDRLKRIMIPASVTEIGESVFTDSHLKEISVDPGNPVFTVSGGELINTRDGVLIAFPHQSDAESCVIPEGVTRIGRLAFYRSHNLKQVVFPDGLLEIGYKAFLSCNHLTAIDLPDSVIRLEESAFGGNSDVQSLRLSAGLTEIAGNFDGLGVSELEIPDGVVSIEESFTSLPNLTEAILPGSVKTVGARSFTFCKKLASITLPAGVEEIRTDFTGCSGTLVVRVSPGSYAEQYCRKHGLNCEPLSE